MVMAAHHLNPQVPNDLAFAESRVRAGTIAAEDVLQDIGALSIFSSDAQAMGRIGEVVSRTWQTAHRMKEVRGSLPGDGRADNHRARRYVAKYTICPAVAHGLEPHIGSVEVGKMADVVLWQPALFGMRPQVVIKGGMAASAALGDPNASVPTPQPVMPRPGFSDHTRAAASTSVAFVSQAALDAGLPDKLDIDRRMVAVESVRGRTKASMPQNTALPEISVNPDTYGVTVDGELIEHPPTSEVPMGQRYYLF